MTAQTDYQEHLDGMAPRLLAKSIEADELRKKLRRWRFLCWFLLGVLTFGCFAWLLIPCGPL